MRDDLISVCCVGGVDHCARLPVVCVDVDTILCCFHSRQLRLSPSATPEPPAVITQKQIATMLHSSILFLGLLCSFAHGLMFYLPAETEKCFTDEYAYDVLVSGEYRVTTPGQNAKELKLRVSWRCSVAALL